MGDYDPGCCKSTERDERGTTTNFAMLDPTERKVAAALFDVGQVREIDRYPWKDGTYDETPDGIQWLANDATALTAAWRQHRTRQALESAADDAALRDPEDPTWGDLHITAALDVLRSEVPS